MQSPFNRGGFSRSSDTPIGKAPGVGYFKGMGIGSRSGKVTVRGQRAWLPSRLKGPTYGPSGSSSATPNLAWNFGRSWPEYRDSTLSLVYRRVGHDHGIDISKIFLVKGLWNDPSGWCPMADGGPSQLR